MGGAAQVRGGERHPAHGRGPHTGRGRPSRQSVESDQSKRREGRGSAQERRQRCLHKPCEHGDLQTAQDQKMHQAGRDQILIQAGRQPRSDAEHHADQQRGVRLRQELFERLAVVVAQPAR